MCVGRVRRCGLIKEWQGSDWRPRRRENEEAEVDRSCLMPAGQMVVECKRGKPDGDGKRRLLCDAAGNA